MTPNQPFLFFVKLNIEVQFNLSICFPDGVFVCKMWHSRRTSELKDDLKNLFESVHVAKPDASRGDSAEIFLVAKGFKGIKC